MQDFLKKEALTLKTGFQEAHGRPYKSTYSAGQCPSLQLDPELRVIMEPAVMDCVDASRLLSSLLLSISIRQTLSMYIISFVYSFMDCSVQRIPHLFLSPFSLSLPPAHLIYLLLIPSPPSCCPSPLLLGPRTPSQLPLLSPHGIFLPVPSRLTLPHHVHGPPLHHQTHDLE